MLAGASVPLLALRLGWRWVYVLGGLIALAVLAAAVRQRVPARGTRPARTAPNVRLRDPLTVWVLAIAFGMSVAAVSIVLAFFVDSAVEAGVTQASAGTALAVASAAAICVRLVAGVASDRLAGGHLRLCAALLAFGFVGFVLLGSGRQGPMTLGVVVALSGGWGFPGVFWFAAVRAYAENPGRITGALTPAALGGVLGPLAFGTLVAGASYRVAWGFAAALNLAAVAGMLLGARRLRRSPGPG
jgi:cyanate permease